MQLMLLDEPIERVSVFKYLGVWLSDDLSWSHHIDIVTMKATKQAGLIYRCFYGVCDSDTLLQLYLRYVRPFCGICCTSLTVWDPHLMTRCKALEKVQKFSLRMSSKQWQEPYDSLLLSSGLHTLESRRKILKLSLFGQVMHGTVHVTHKLPQFRLRSYSSETLQVPISRTRAYEFSFYPNVTTMWNALPLDMNSSSSLLAFKRHLNSFF